MTQAPAHPDEPAPSPAPASLADSPAPGNDIEWLIAEAERTAEIPLAAFAALAELLTYLCERPGGEAA
jgi:hypothetical protein